LAVLVGGGRTCVAVLLVALFHLGLRLGRRRLLTWVAGTPIPDPAARQLGLLELAVA
jgi:hypothetical protein